MTLNSVLSEKKLKEMEWAESLVAKINADSRDFVKYKESRAVTDLKHMIETSVLLYGENNAFHQKFKGDSEYTAITYRQMLEDVNGLGTALLAKGLKNRRIAVIGENCYQWAVSYLSVVCGTGVAVPLDKELNREEIKALIVKAEVSCVIFSGRYREMFMSIREDGDTGIDVLVDFHSEAHEDVLSWRALIDEGKRMAADGDTGFTHAEIDNEALSVILFTSGTTGSSKGVMLCHRNIVSDLMVSPTVLKVNQQDIFFSVLPLHHTYECTCGFLMPLYKGASIAYCQGLKYIAKNLQEVKPTMFLGVPAIFENLYRTIWKNIRKQGREKLIKRLIRLNRGTKKVGIDLGKKFFRPITDVFGGRMRILICGGAAINPEVLNGIRDFGILALQGYGLTECSPMGALNPDTAPNSSSIGVSFPGFELKVSDTDREGIGEICIKGDNVMLGYYQMPEETAEVIDEDGWFHTGDLGYMNKQGYAFITGRKKNVIITKNGKNVYPEEIEYLISLSPYVSESFVFSQEQSDEQDITIVASVKPDMDMVEERLGDKASEEAVKKLIWEEIDKVNEKSPFYRKVKKVIIRKTDFIKNTSNKLVRFAENNRKEV